jgi:hypothetical protein
MQFPTLSPKSTTYYTSTSLPDCGPRCANVYAFESNEIAAFFYKCQVNVSNVANATLQEQMVQDDRAKMAAGAIALQGYQAQDRSNQSQTFPDGSQSIYGVGQNGSSDGMAALIRQFAIGVFVTSDSVMSNIDPPAHQLLPGHGVMLSLDNLDGMIAIFATLLTVHFLLFVIGSYFANKVLVVKDSYLAIALLLQPVLDKIANRGFISGGKDNKLDELQMVYGYYTYERGGGVRRVAISEDDRVTSPWEGVYDS